MKWFNGYKSWRKCIWLKICFESKHFFLILVHLFSHCKLFNCIIQTSFRNLKSKLQNHLSIWFIWPHDNWSVHFINAHRIWLIPNSTCIFYSISVHLCYWWEFSNKCKCVIFHLNKHCTLSGSLKKNEWFVDKKNMDEVWNNRISMNSLLSKSDETHKK